MSIDLALGARREDWMRELARHYADSRRAHPDEKFLLLFDIDGTILDLRYPVLHVLGWYDFVNGTDYFSGLRLEDIESHEDDVDYLLERVRLPARKAGEIRRWHRQQLWGDAAWEVSHVPFRGVLEIIRWFQLQPGTFVGLNTGRAESSRQPTLESLNRLGAEFRVVFDSGLLHMSPTSTNPDILEAKIEAIRAFELRGFRVFGVVDNEPACLEAIGREFGQRTERLGDDGILLLHAETIFQSRRELLPPGARSGSRYDLTQLISSRSLPQHMEFVWHGANSSESLSRFLDSPVRWVEMDIQLHPLTKEPVLKNESFSAAPQSDCSPIVRLEEALSLVADAGRAAKLDLKENGELVPKVLELVERAGFHQEDLWFNADLGCLGEAGIRSLAQQKPCATMQVPVNFLSSLVLGAPEKAVEIVDMLRAWGVNRMSLGWSTPYKRELLDMLDDLRMDVNIYNVPDLESFLQAVLLAPRSITSDFGVLDWGPRSGAPITLVAAR